MNWLLLADGRYNVKSMGKASADREIGDGRESKYDLGWETAFHSHFSGIFSLKHELPLLSL